MSNVNIKRAIENIRSGTNVYTPIVEVVVNAIQAIESLDKSDGHIEILLSRSPQLDSEDSLSEIIGFEISDNGIGFNNENKEAFDTLYTAQKIQEGGKGFGRFTCLKYFEDVKIQSVYFLEGVYKSRQFMMGKDTDIIVDESVSDSNATETGTVVSLIAIKRSFPDKGLTTIARTLVEKLLPYFVSEDRECPAITLKESDSSESILLNDYLSNTSSSLIREVKSARGEFSRKSTDGDKEFTARVFKIYSPKNQRSKVSLVAHRREVTSTSLQAHIPEFADEFFDRDAKSGGKNDRNFIIKVYVFSDYHDEHVSLERAGFEFHQDSDLLLGISQKEIEITASEFARNAVGTDVQERQQRKRDQVDTYVRENAPWYRNTLEKLDISEVPYNPTEEQIESRLHYHEYREEVRVKSDVRKLLESNEPNELRDKASEIVKRITGSSKNELAHYVALRRSVLDIFKKSLSSNSDGSYSSEDVVHDIIFPRKNDSESISFDDHNLWIVDERLNFTEYLASDLPINGPRTDRPDILAYDNRIGFRGDNEATNPVIIFEFKKPQRDDFVNPSSSEDPVQQIIRYVSQIRAGKFKTRQGREILVSDNTPFFGYVVCDLSPKVREWAETNQDFKPMPDRMGYFRWHQNLNLYLEILGWDKLLKDAEMRNKIFFHKLGLN